MLRVCYVWSLFFCALSCAPPLYAVNPPVIGPPVAVFLDFEANPSPSAVAAMKSEIAAIMAPSGLRFEYHSLKEDRTGESFADLAVLSFKGACQWTQPALYNELGPLFEHTALAFTVVSDGRVLPFSDVKCDVIRSYIAPNLATAPIDQRDAILGRAMGRVVAHELFHIFAGTVTHGRDGVARSYHTRKELTADEFRFSRQESLLLHDLEGARLKTLPTPSATAFR